MAYRDICNATYVHNRSPSNSAPPDEFPLKPPIKISETSSNLSVSILPHGRGTEGKEQDTISEINEGVVPMPHMALNHVSRLCKSVKASVEFYIKVLGFVVIERPPSLDFNGAWLFNYGVGVHLVQKPEDVPLPDADPNRLDPMDNHISFQPEDTRAMEKRLKEMKIKYLKRTINEEGSPIDQMFFKDPDGFMIEICNCENLELVPAGAFDRDLQWRRSSLAYEVIPTLRN